VRECKFEFLWCFACKCNKWIINPLYCGWSISWFYKCVTLSLKRVTVYKKWTHHAYYLWNLLYILSLKMLKLFPPFVPQEWVVRGCCTVVSSRCAPDWRQDCYSTGLCLSYFSISSQGIQTQWRTCVSQRNRAGKAWKLNLTLY